MNKSVKLLEEKLGIVFKNKDLLYKALTHTSYANENKSIEDSNEKLEFLGDAVLELCMRNHLFSNYNLSEGEMTKMRASLVCEDALAIYANKLGLSDYLFLGKGEELSGGRQRNAILADAFEAVIGAIFKEFGFNATHEVFLRIVIAHINEVYVKDYKSILQELVQSTKKSVTYKITKETGPSHNKLFEAAVIMNSITLGVGTGTSKLKAEQEAARAALDKAAGLL